MGWIYRLFGTMLGFFSDITGGSYALALLLYALVFKILFLPFSIKQQKNQIAMAKLAPKIALIRAKYKGRTDRVTMQKQQEEIMALQQKEGYSPFSGCLPLLLQMPIIIFLYNVIRKPLSYIAKFPAAVITEVNNLVSPDKALDQIALISKINEYRELGNIIEIEGFDLSKIPDFNFLGMNLAKTPSFSPISWLVLIPFIAAATQWFTMWITRKVNGNGMQMGNDDAQAQMSMKMMDLVMPLMTVFFAFGFSGMLGVYWIYQSLLSIVQTLILAKVMPIPKFTEEDIKAIRKAEKEQEKINREVMKSQPKFRSLHYIDEDDYDELPTVKNNNQNSNKPKSNDIPEIKD